MRYYLVTTLCVITFCLGATDYVSPKDPGEYDEYLQCIVDVSGLCETEYVEEILELCKDYDIETPEKTEVSDVEAFFRSVGIELAYRIIEHPVEVACYTTATIVGGYFLVKYLRS